MKAFGELLENDGPDISREIDLNDRDVGEIDLQQHRLLGIVRQVRFGEVDAITDLLKSVVDVGSRLELGGDDRRAFLGDGGQLLDSFEASQLLFELVGDLFLDICRRRSGVDGVDDDEWNLDVGK